MEASYARMYERMSEMHAQLDVLRSLVAAHEAAIRELAKNRHPHPDGVLCSSLEHNQSPQTSDAELTRGNPVDMTAAEKTECDGTQCEGCQGFLDGEKHGKVKGLEKAIKLTPKTCVRNTGGCGDSYCAGVMDCREKIKEEISRLKGKGK